MKESTYKTYDDLPLFLNAAMVAQVLGVTERTSITTRRGIKKNGSLLYTLIPMHEVMERCYEHQLAAIDRVTERQHVQKKLTEQFGT